MHVPRHLLIALGLVLAAPAAQAEGPSPTVFPEGTDVTVTPRPRVGKVGLRVLQIFPDTQQALVLDKDSGRHVVVGEGERVGKYAVVEIDDDQIVVQVGARELVLLVDAAAPPPVAPSPIAAITGERTVLDPYAAAAAPAAPAVAIEAAGPLDPYGPLMAPPGSMGATFGMIDPRVPVREVIAPSDQRAAVAAPVDPYGTAAAAPIVATSAPSPAPSPAPIAATPAPAAPMVEVIRADAMTVPRAALSAALSDFDKLAKELGFARIATGVRLSRVPVGSYFHGLGFRAGDVVTAIDGAPIRTLDDAAGVYVRLGSAKKLAVEIDRGSAHGTLKFALK